MDNHSKVGSLSYSRSSSRFRSARPFPLPSNPLGQSPITTCPKQCCVQEAAPEQMGCAGGDVWVETARCFAVARSLGQADMRDAGRRTLKETVVRASGQ